MNSKIQAVITLSNNTRVIRLGLILSKNTRTRLVQYFEQTRFKREFTKKKFLRNNKHWGYEIPPFESCKSYFLVLKTLFLNFGQIFFWFWGLVNTGRYYLEPKFFESDKKIKNFWSANLSLLDVLQRKLENIKIFTLKSYIKSSAWFSWGN